MTKLSHIDELLCEDHAYLDASDQCAFVHEYTRDVGYQHSATNSLISNLKKSNEKKGRDEYRYKGQAIETCAREFLAVTHDSSAVYVPMPPSRSRADPAYDDRMLQILRAMQRSRPGMEVRDLLE